MALPPQTGAVSMLHCVDSLTSPSDLTMAQGSAHCATVGPRHRAATCPPSAGLVGAGRGCPVRGVGQCLMQAGAAG